ncbi:hypothetical protein PPERSA_06897 [Pseudocohnilembus persalinus]|uniref:EF-hand domain-containing protein n=1 Tax=Pseudocohnilembus persalinus TaxID=266149 RepID=A0A0V0QYF7_PSEPJ|nr:hypothetical protein PPERSA_06897 [Pseudocohnilembus persalinus]|eukprot:KRX07282.1 hypothetical protein PPERSA_06897 [Pseudocohnilembus persalinus]
MYNKFASITENSKQEEYLKQKIKETFSLFQKEHKLGQVENKEIPYIMRYLGQFPSEAQVRDSILPLIEQDEVSDYIKYEKFEPYMLKVLKEREFEPDDPDTLLAAFKLLDPDENGYIEVDMMRNFLEKEGIEFRKEETDQFISFATNKEPNPQVIYYEDYISRLTNYIEKHTDSIMKGYENFDPKK